MLILGGLGSVGLLVQLLIGYSDGRTRTGKVCCRLQTSKSWQLIAPEVSGYYSGLVSQLLPYPTLYATRLLSF